jgi:hypothetical protein
VGRPRRSANVRRRNATAIGRISSKFPSTHPAYCPVIPVSDDAGHNICSVASGSNPVVLSIPASAVDVDGARFSLYIAGRIKLYTGATPGQMNLYIDIGNPILGNRVSVVPLPANASGVIIPFSYTISFIYDAVTQQLGGTESHINGTSSRNLNEPFTGRSRYDP